MSVNIYQSALQHIPEVSYLQCAVIFPCLKFLHIYVFNNSDIQQSTGLDSSLNHLLLFSVSENKTLCHPASVDSLSTSAGTEDHVSMGCFAARKALQVS